MTGFDIWSRGLRGSGRAGHGGVVVEHAERGQRILAAAGELLLAWGYRRVTIDEIARRAKVGKGTVYLHWRTKDALLLAVLLTYKARSQRRELERMRADPLEILPSRMMHGHYRDFLEEPVLRAVYTDDSDVLGRLNDIAKKELAGLMAEGERVLQRHLEVLREHGLVRTDSDVSHQRYALMAMATGFFMAEALLFDRAPGPAEIRADILAHTVRGALETRTGSDSPDDGSSTDAAVAAAAAAAPEIIALYEHLEELSAQEMRRQLRH
ncbi:TetR/AcrR family transcriptional regulator [Streptomyces halobius]|uniref:TetR/AcrR family transcriptional regulator n=1 Tax=Streptomyces halobius TaxID=2879846 RepID=A0ABY4M1Y0_9ACTN|nr:TetR/AcrR family transcriptional regulator [Streptomyces halobius]UQA90884.1 TetR/AcrR family transcriptional regulator [Streptomyces halobius]